jgi:hypothetical protein
VTCPKCKIEVEPVVREKGPHLGLYCPTCDAWLKWGSKQEFAVGPKIEVKKWPSPGPMIEPKYLECPFDY